MMARNAATHWRPLLITCRKQAISLRTGLLVKWGFNANHEHAQGCVVTFETDCTTSKNLLIPRCPHPLPKPLFIRKLCFITRTPANPAATYFGAFGQLAIDRHLSLSKSASSPWQN